MAVTPVDTTTQTQMAKSSSRFLLGYLLVSMSLSLYAVCSLWSAQPQVAGGPLPQGCSTGPAISKLYPEWVNVGSTTSDFLIVGCGFTPSTLVKLNGAQRPTISLDAGHIRASLSPADVAIAGTAVVTLSNGGADFGSAVLQIVPSALHWQLLGFSPWTITQELQLLLMVLFTGGFGSCVYALKSLANYQGDNKLYETWFVYYVVQPFEGSGIAFILYLVIRGGFLSGASADKTINQFGMCAIAGLAGTFSDIAFLKLREVFMTLFKPQDDRGGKLTLKIGNTVLPAGTAGKPYKQALQSSGGTAPLKWTVTPELPKELTLDARTGVIAGTPSAPSKGAFTFTVTDSANPPVSSTVSLTLEVQ